MSLRWVLTTKETTDGIIPEARLVARGFEEDCLDKSEKKSPTCSMFYINPPREAGCPSTHT